LEGKRDGERMHGWGAWGGWMKARNGGRKKGGKSWMEDRRKELKEESINGWMDGWM
jgi:hypothetical protein